MKIKISLSIPFPLKLIFPNITPFFSIYNKLSPARIVTFYVKLDNVWYKIWKRIEAHYRVKNCVIDESSSSSAVCTHY